MGAIVFLNILMGGLGGGWIMLLGKVVTLTAIYVGHLGLNGVGVQLVKDLVHPHAQLDNMSSIARAHHVQRAPSVQAR